MYCSDSGPPHSIFSRAVLYRLPMNLPWPLAADPGHVYWWLCLMAVSCLLCMVALGLWLPDSYSVGWCFEPSQPQRITSGLNFAWQKWPQETQRKEPPKISSATTLSLSLSLSLSGPGKHHFHNSLLHDISLIFYVCSQNALRLALPNRESTK